MVNDSESRRVQDAADALGFLDPGTGSAKYQYYREKITACLAGLPFPMTITERLEVADQAISDVLRSKSFDPTNGPLRYMKTTAQRLARKLQEKRCSEKLVGEFSEIELNRGSGDLHSGGDGPPATSNREKEDDEVWDLVDRAIARIPKPEHQEAVRRQSFGQDNATISQETRTSKNTVYQHRLRAVKAMQAELSPHIRQGHLNPRQSQGDER